MSSSDEMIIGSSPSLAAPIAEGGAGEGSDSSGDNKELGREAERHSIFMHGDLQLSHMTAPQKVRIRNLSEGGALADTPLPAQIGETLIVDLPNIGPVRGVVAWAEVGRFGIKFDDKVDPRQVRRRVNISKPEPEFYDQPHLKGRGRPGFKR